MAMGAGSKAVPRLQAFATRAREAVSIVEEPSTRFYGDVAIATFQWTTVADKSIGGIITCVIIKKGTGWSILVLQNTDFR